MKTDRKYINDNDGQNNSDQPTNWLQRHSLKITIATLLFGLFAYGKMQDKTDMSSFLNFFNQADAKLAETEDMSIATATEKVRPRTTTQKKKAVVTADTSDEQDDESYSQTAGCTPSRSRAMQQYSMPDRNAYAGYERNNTNISVRADQYYAILGRQHSKSLQESVLVPHGIGKVETLVKASSDGYEASVSNDDLFRSVVGTDNRIYLKKVGKGESKVKAIAKKIIWPF